MGNGARTSRHDGSVVLLLALTAGLATATPGFAQSPGTDAGHLKAEEFYSNVQAFKGAPAEQLMPAMYFIASALGVECEFCHSADRTAESPHKIAARRMIQLTQAINNGSFGGARSVTCFTCHRGSPHPDNAPPAADAAFRSSAAARGPAPSAQLGPMPTPQQLFEKYAAAAGGGTAPRVLAGVTTNGTVTDSGGRQEPYRLVIKGPAWRFATRHQGTRDVPAALTGDKGWLIDRGNHLRHMRYDELDAARLEEALWYSVAIKDAIAQPRTEGLETAPGHPPAFVVSGRTDALPLVRLYFDQATGMLTRLAYFTETGLGRYPTEIAVTEYQTVDGVSVPSKWTVTEILNRVWSYQMTTLRRDLPVDDALFVKPAGRTEH